MTGSYSSVMTDEDDEFLYRNRRRTSHKLDASPNLRHPNPPEQDKDTSIVTNTTCVFQTGDGGSIGTVQFPVPSSASPTVTRGERNIGSKTAPLHIIRDPHLSHTYLEIQYSNDPEDGYQRIDARQDPHLPKPLRTRDMDKKFHPQSAYQIFVSADCFGTTTTTSQNWPDLP